MPAASRGVVRVGEDRGGQVRGGAGLLSWGSENDAAGRVGHGSCWLDGGGGGAAAAAAAGALAAEHRELGRVLELAGTVHNDQHAVAGLGGLLAGCKVAGY